MHARLRKRLQLMVIAVITCVCPVAIAQVPPHYPGTICFTQSFWCWAVQPGPPGAVCWCPSPYGWVPGMLG